MSTNQNGFWTEFTSLDEIFAVEVQSGGGEGGQGGHNLPLPVPHSPASRTFLSLCLPTTALSCVSPVITYIKKIRSAGLVLKLWCNFAKDENCYRSVFLVNLSFQ